MPAEDADGNAISDADCIASLLAKLKQLLLHKLTNKLHLLVQLVNPGLIMLILIVQFYLSFTV